MKVLHVLTTDQRRGAETSAIALQQELRRRGHDAQAVALVASGHERTLGVPVLGGPRRLSPTVLVRLHRRARRADVVVAHGSSTLPACALALSGRGAPPFVYANIGDPLYWANDAARVRRVSWLLRRAAGVAARSQGAAEDLHTVLGVPQERIMVIPNGRDVARFSPTDAAGQERARTSIDVPLGVPIVLALGSLNPEKRVDLAVRAVALLGEVHLLVAGEGPDGQSLRELADAEAPGRIHFLGSVDDVPAVLRAADVVVLTSDSEGLPGALIEAGLAGLPVVATDVGFVKDIVRDDETGMLVEPGCSKAVAGALAEALRRRADLGSRARQWCLTEFDMRHIAELWEQLIVTAAHRAR